MSKNQQKELIVDFVSDVVCPWCVIGYKRLELTAKRLALKLEMRWHPFELTPDMGKEGENLKSFLEKKYGHAFNGTMEARKTLTRLGEQLGFAYNYHEGSMRYNSFKSHQLLHFAREHHLEHPLKIALFEANFTDNQNISDINTLVDIAEKIGLDRQKSHEILKKQSYVQEVREEQKYWVELGVNAIPFMLLNKAILIQGAPEQEVLDAKVLNAIEN